MLRSTPPSYFLNWGMKYARGNRTATPFVHFLMYASCMGYYKYYLDQDREEVVRLPPPPVAAPQSDAMTLTQMMEMGYRRGFNPQAPLTGGGGSRPI